MKESAAAAGPTISVNTSSTPTICAHSDTATATIIKKAVETKRSGAPLASASSLCRDAKISGRAIKPSAIKLTTARSASDIKASLSTPSTLPNKSAAACEA